jgi:septum formation protein
MLIDDLKKYRVILASKSPRRQQLLIEMGLSFDVVIRDYAESYPADLKGNEIPLYVAREKAKSFKNEIAVNEIVITADTIVWCNNEVLGKPVDAGDAKRMISELSGNTHEVITGVTLISASKERTFTDSSSVTFEILTEEEINYYIDNFKPFDKAGAYGIQEWIGVVACSRIEGSYFNVVGLPVQKLYKELKEFIR